MAYPSYEAFPSVVFAKPGQQVSLDQVLQSSFGSPPSTFTYGWLYEYSASDFSGWNFSYWNPSKPSMASWSINGAPIASDTSVVVDAGNLDGVSFTAGNNIGSNLSYGVVTSTSPASAVNYQITVVDSQFAAYEVKGRPITAADIVNTAQAFATAYSGVPNANDCHWIASAIVAATGATLPTLSSSINPSENEEGGFWRIAHRGSANGPSDWFNLTQPGDIVRLGWSTGSFHTFNVMGNENADGSLPVFDNGNRVISLKPNAQYDTQANQSTITIYRLTTDNLYLINGSSGDDAIPGTVNNDEMVGGLGNDTFTGGIGNDVVLGNQGLDMVLGNQGNDVLAGGQDNDAVAGGQDNDCLYGNAANDILYGNQGADVIVGGRGDDTVFAGQGDDTLYGNLGNDVLSGNLGADRLVFGSNEGEDKVMDFSSGQGDRLDLEGQTYSVTQSADGALVHLSGGGSITLVGVSASGFNGSEIA
ncbi:calcium-binding protein [Bradyrhizobium liaoningense]|uniref:calcium-binding protein n=1 Tax=Bradyrhizobium liaoningense TaxID=43992 RepID=UPI001BABE765|nr:calcium-binding protein [Bradyrhizobium liaoningense]MBR0904580.1 hypothetical protein [Bradyrhizobium liaoningense]